MGHRSGGDLTPVHAVPVGDYEVVLFPQGNLVSTTAEANRDRFAPKLERARRGPVLLDLTAVDAIDHMGVRLLVGVIRECQRRRLTLRVLAPSPYVRRLMKLMHLHQHVDIVKAGAAE